MAHLPLRRHTVVSDDQPTSNPPPVEYWSRGHRCTVGNHAGPRRGGRTNRQLKGAILHPPQAPHQAPTPGADLSPPFPLLPESRDVGFLLTHPHAYIGTQRRLSPRAVLSMATRLFSRTLLPRISNPAHRPLALTRTMASSASSSPRTYEWLVVVPDKPGTLAKRLEVRP